MPQRIRTFIAVELDAAIRKAAADLIDKLRPADADVKWVDPEKLHLTVKFLGGVDAEDVARVCDAVEKAVADVSPFQLAIRGAGAFPNTRRPQTIWLGAGEGDDRMAKLAGRVDKALEKFGFRRETRRYRTHLTLGRFRRDGHGSGELGRLLQQFADYDPGRMPVEELVTFSSQLTPTGPIYEAMGRADLGGR
jgi:RNA 2',3'-cyclic 3'-phosphodiesterase